MVPLAVLIYSNVDPDRFARIEAAAEKELGKPLVGNSGEVETHGADVTYSYVGSEVTFSILKVPEIWGVELMKPLDLQNRLVVWLDSVK